MSTRQSIITAIENRMKTILTANGYQTNAGQRVYTWRTTPLADNELPALLIYDRDVTKNMAISTLDTDYYDLAVDIEVATAGSGSREFLRAAMDDVRMAVKAGPGWSGLALHTAFEAADMNLEQAEKLTGGNVVRLRITHQD